MAYQVGDIVTINPNASRYATGESMPGWVKNGSYGILQVGNGRVLLGDTSGGKGIYSWVNTSDLGGGSRGGSSSSSSDRYGGSSSSGSRPSSSGGSSSGEVVFGGGGSSGGDSGYLDSIREAQRLATEQAVANLEKNRPLLEQQKEEAARQAYIRMMQQQRDTPQQLKAAGLTGGLSESSVISQNADYSNQQNSILNAYNKAIAELDSQVAEVRRTGDYQLAEREAEYRFQMEQLRKQQEMQEREWAFQMEQFQRELDAQKEMMDYEQALKNKYAASQWSSSRTGGRTGSSGSRGSGATDLDSILRGGASLGDGSLLNPALAGATAAFFTKDMLNALNRR